VVGHVELAVGAHRGQERRVRTGIVATIALVVVSSTPTAATVPASLKMLM
jgi:hypothetical protein